MYHTSPEQIKEGTINSLGIAGSCLFFSDNIYSMNPMRPSYVYEAKFRCVPVNRLYDDGIIEEIAERFGCDTGLAEELLDGREGEFCQDFQCDEYDSWWLQGKRGECAVAMGYDGCIDEDEQGTVYIVPMLEREKELTFVKVLEVGE